MDVRILGQLEVESAGRRLDLGGHKQRAVLAVLVLEANRPVSVDHLVDFLWDGRPPAQGVGTVRAYISNLRRVLEPARPRGRPAQVLTSESGGYVLHLAPDELDAARFERLVDDGRAAREASATVDLLQQALALWRGPALADFTDEPFAWPARARLEECRLVAIEEHIEASLDCGRHQALVADIQALVTAHPLRERLRGQLMLALYRSGRQAEALRVYEAGRRVLAEELGIDPGPALQAIEHAILDQDATLDYGLPAAPARPAGLVGREGPLGELRMNLGQALAGAGRVVLIGGEAGIGKTHLAQVLAEHAVATGATVVWGAAHDGDGAPPFWPWVQVVRRLVEDDPAALGEDGAQIAQIVPELGDASAPAPADPELARFRLYDAITRFLQRRARSAPLVVVLDDLHWADLPSLQLLSFLAAAVSDSRLLVVATYRDTEVSVTPALADTLANLSRRPVVTRIRLQGLTEGDVGRLVADAPADIVKDLYRRTEGNPFFVVELARLYRETQSLDAVPESVRDVVRHRLRRLPDAGREVLALAAVIGQEFDLDVLVAATGLEEEETLSLLEEPLAVGVILETPAPGRFRFSHALTRDTVYEEMSLLRRARAHGRVATALERRRERTRPEAVSEIAHHFLQASTLGFVAEAIEYAEEAAGAALGGLAFEQAERHLGNALDLLPRLPAGSETSSLELRLRMKLASLLFTTRGYSDAGVRPALSRALDLCREVGSRHQLLATLWGTWGYAMGVPDLPLARKLADELLDEARRTGEPAYAVAGHVAAGMTAVHQGELHEAHDHLRARRAFPEPDSDVLHELAQMDLSDVVLEKHPWVGGHGLNGVCLYLLGYETDALEEIRVAHDVARRLGQPFGMTLAYVIECGLAGVRQDPSAVAAVVEDGLDLARTHGFRQWELLLVGLRGWSRAALADAAAGAGETAVAIEQLAAGGNGMLQHLLLALLAEAYRQAGRTEDAVAAADRGLRAAEVTGECFFEAELHRIRGELLSDRDSLETALLVAQRQGAVALIRRAEASLARFPDKAGIRSGAP